MLTKIPLSILPFYKKILLFVISWQEKNFFMLPVDKKIYDCMLPSSSCNKSEAICVKQLVMYLNTWGNKLLLPVDKGDKEEKKKPLAKAHPLPHYWHQLALQNCWLKTSYNCMCVYIHMFSSHPICIWRNKLFQVGLVPKSSGIKYMVDANNGHPNIVSNINY